MTPPFARPFEQAHDSAPLERRALMDVTRMEQPTYEFDVEVKETEALVAGRYGFVAMVIDLCCHHPDGAVQRFATPFGEYHGDDAAEAEARAREAVARFIEAHTPS